jgi:acyl carrier protein
MLQVSLDELKQLLAENCMLKIDLATVQEETPFFGPESLGLDSIDALQLTVALEKKYGVSIKDPNLAREIFQNLGALRNWLQRQA